MLTPLELLSTPLQLTLSKVQLLKECELSCAETILTEHNKTQHNINNENLLNFIISNPYNGCQNNHQLNNSLFKEYLKK